MERNLPRDHEDHIAEKGFNSLSHYNLVHKFISMPQALKIPDAKSCGGSRIGDARKVASLESDPSKEQKRGHPGSSKRPNNSPFCYADGHLSSQKYGVRTEVSKITKAELCSEVTS